MFCITKSICEFSHLLKKCLSNIYQLLCMVALKRGGGGSQHKVDYEASALCLRLFLPCFCYIFVKVCGSCTIQRNACMASQWIGIFLCWFSKLLISRVLQTSLFRLLPWSRLCECKPPWQLIAAKTDFLWRQDKTEVCPWLQLLDHFLKTLLAMKMCQSSIFYSS